MLDSTCPNCDGCEFVDFDNGEGSTSSRRCEACSACPECSGEGWFINGAVERCCDLCEGTGVRAVNDPRPSHWSAKQLGALFAPPARDEIRGAA